MEMGQTTKTLPTAAPSSDERDYVVLLLCISCTQSLPVVQSTDGRDSFTILPRVVSMYRNIEKIYERN